MDDGNVYLNGAKNMADAIRQSANQSERNGMAGMHSTTASIAQRMKQNRDAIMGHSTFEPSSNPSNYGQNSPKNGQSPFHKGKSTRI